MRRKLGLTFPVLVDPDCVTAKAYGVWNERAEEVPHPTAVVVDREGVARYVRVDEKYSQRPEPEELIEAVKALR